MVRWLSVMVAMLIACSEHADTFSADALIKRIQNGGYVLVMRHTASPLALPDAATADAGNPTQERQLDDTGKRDAATVGAGLRAHKIAIGKVYSSETFRALQTVTLAQLPKATPTPELSEGDQGMALDTNQARADWLRKAVRAKPQGKTNTVLVTHAPNLSNAFAGDAKDLGAGAIMVFQPDGKGGTALLGRIRVEDWAS